MTEQKRTSDAIAIALLIVFCTIPFVDVLFGASRFYIRDLTRYYFPTKRIIREVILAGDFPYWNRYYSAGQPLAANPEYEVFYPPQWLILLPSYDLGYRLHILIHVYAAAIGMYLLLRSMRLRPESSFYGALVFALGGVFVSFINLLPILFCVTWIPWILLFVRRLFLHRRVVDFALAAFFLGIQGLCGEPTSLLQTWFLVGSYALYRSWYSERRVRGLLINSTFVVLLVLSQLTIGAAQLVPAMDHARDCARARPFEFDLVTSWSMPFARPAELVFPNLFGHIYKKGTWYWGSGMYHGTSSPFIFSVYLGLISIALVFAALFVRPRGGRLLIWILAVSIIIALGGHTPLFRLLYDAGVRSIRYPEKFAFMGLFAVNVFAAMMFDRFIQGDRRTRQVALWFVGVTTTFAIVVWVSSFTPLYGQLFSKLWVLGNSAATKLEIKLSVEDWLVASVRGLVAFGFLLAFRTRYRRSWCALLFPLVLIDFIPVSFEVLPRFPAKFFTPPPVVHQLLPEPKRYRIFHEADWYGSSDLSRKFFTTGDDVYWVVRNGLFPMTTASWGFQTVLERDYDKTALLNTVDFTDAMWRVRDSGQTDWARIFMSMSNAGARGQFRNFDQEKKRVRGNFKASTPIDFLPFTWMPRYYLADQIIKVRDQNDFVKHLRSGRWSSGVAFVPFEPFAPSGGAVLSMAEGPNSATIRLDSKGDNFLVMSVTGHKYWSATIDGRPAKLEAANIGYQGVRVGAGRHVVRMKYRNPLVPPSVLASLIGIALSLLFAVAGSHRNAPPILEPVEESE